MNIEYQNEHYPASSQLVSIDELARLSRHQVDIIHLMMDGGLIEPFVREPQPLFYEATVPIIWKIMRIRNDLGVNWAGIGVILTLLERVDHLEKELVRLEQNSDIIS